MVKAALRGEPQHITRSGKQAMVVLYEEAFESLQRSAHQTAPGFVAHLLTTPPKDVREEVDVKRSSLALRDIGFS